MHDPNAVINPDYRVMEVLLGLMGRFRKTYVYPSRGKILELLKAFTGRSMSLRTLARHMRALERDHHLRRQRRYPELVNGATRYRTTLYFPGGRYLARLSRGANALIGWAKARSQRDARRMLPRSAHNPQPPSAVDSSEPVDNHGPP
jgi:hypothetical protein